VSEFIHFACTSEDINNLSHALMLKGARDAVLLPALEKVIARLSDLAHDLADLPMLSRTHGQRPRPPRSARNSPTRSIACVALGCHRRGGIMGRSTAAVGNYNAHLSAYPSSTGELRARNS